MEYKYRCPYCGEPAFPTLERLGFPAEAVGKYAVYFPKCPHCKQIARRASTVGEWCFLSVMTSLLGAVTLPLFVWSVKADSPFGDAMLLVSILLLLGGYAGIHLFLFHFDKSSPEQRRDPLFTVTVPRKERLPVRVGEIYVCRLLGRNPANGIPQVIGLVHRIRKTEEQKSITFRVIRCDDTALPAEGQRVCVLTASDKVVEGTVTAITPQKKL